jgi:DMSO/TMAO reductase YedYZ heme-binding membrane subunit
MTEAMAVPTGATGGTAVRSGVIIGLLGFLSVVPFYVWIHDLQVEGRSAAALGMASMHMDRMNVFWSFPILQATGIAALIWAYFGVALGLLESGKTVPWLPLSRPQVDRIHRQISLLVICLIVVHAGATALDAMGDNFVSAFVPWQESWTQAQFAYNLGIFALYLALILGPTYYLRRQIGATRWRFLHRFSLVVYVLSFWHTMILGLDISYYGWVRPFMWLAQIPLLLLFIGRLMRPATAARHLSPRRQAVRSTVSRGLVAASWVGVVAAAVIVLSGNSDFITNI